MIHSNPAAYAAALETMTDLLIGEGIPYVTTTLANGYQITFPSVKGADIICHDYSYGGAQGLWESYGFPWDEGDVTGNLTSAEFIRLYQEYFS